MLPALGPRPVPRLLPTIGCTGKPSPATLAAKPKIVLDADPGRHRHLIVPSLAIPDVQAAAVLKPAAETAPKARP